MSQLTPRIGLAVLARPQFDTAFAQDMVDRACRSTKIGRAHV